MKTKVLTLLIAAGLSLPAILQAATQADANGDGVLTIDEVQAVRGIA